MKEIKDMLGILSLVSISENFDKDYSRVSLSNVFSTDIPNAKAENGLLLKVEGEGRDDCFLPVSITPSSFGLLKTLVHKNDNPPELDLPSFAHFFCRVMNMYGIRMVLGYIDQYCEGIKYVSSSIVLEKDNETMSLDMKFGDLMSISICSGLPIYVRNKIVDDFAVGLNQVNQGGIL